MDSLVVEDLGKCYYLGAPREQRKPKTLRERIAAPFNRMRPEQREFWALKNVSFRVEPGTILGIIGANGVGKSTLLKILARVTAPTTGRVVGVGRVVSLLELGAGFDPDLPARENILMNAAMLGIPRGEAVRRLDEIIAFAEVEQFADSPLKLYSSGMYLRLAFSVAINMNPQILLADEILAVGDQAFQDRCLQRVEEGGRQGLTVLFVSHDMDAILRVCNRVMWLNAGEMVRSGDPEEVVDEYQNAIWSQADATRSERGRRSNRYAEMLSVRLVSSAGRELGGAPISEDVYVRIRFQTAKGRLWVRAALDLNTRGYIVFRTADSEPRWLAEPGVYDVLARIPANLLAELNYTVSVSLIFRRDDETKEYPLIDYNTLAFLAYSTDERAVPSGRRLDRVGYLAPRLEWTVKREENAART